MLFTSFPFIVFLFAVVITYYLVPGKFKILLLLAANIVFYAFSGWLGLVCVAATFTSAWYAGKRINGLTKEGDRYPDKDAGRKAQLKILKLKKKRWMIAAVLFNLAILAAFKCMAGMAGGGMVAAGGVAASIMPMGISFYTFKAVSHIVDAYRSKTSDDSRESLLRVALFVSWFPEIVQGPLSRFGDLGATLFQQNSFESKPFTQGLRRVCYGYFKKLVVADRLFPAIAVIMASWNDFHASYLLLAVFLYMVALYADFTGGIDITIGTALMMGVRTKENFNSPYFAKSIMDYWRRWHMTMGAWFRDYLYYPLSSAKPLLSLTKPIKNRFGQMASARVSAIIVTMIVWFSIGVWHGATANFIIWGLANGVVIVIHQELMGRYERFAAASAFAKTRVFGAMQIVLTFILMSFINNIDLYSFKDLMQVLGRIFSSELFSGFWAGGAGEIGLRASDTAAAAAGVAVMILAGIFSRTLFKDKDWAVTACVVQCGILCLTTLVFGCYGVGYEARQFIYNQF